MDDFTFEYLPQRGITKETFKFYDCKTKVGIEGNPISVGFHYSASKATKVRLIGEKTFYWVGTSKPGLFGLDKFAAGSHKVVTITEGELDALSLYQVLRTPVVSVQSASSAVRDCSVDYEFLNSFERIYLAFDSDAPGREATQRVAKLFDYNKVFVVKFSNRKDANEYLQHGEADELRNIWHNSKKYLPETVISSLEEFHKILTQPHKEGFPYPFPTLNKMTYGIRTGETVLIKAPEKVGKTALMHSIEHHILKGTKDNVGSIYLEEDKRRHLQSLAGLELRKPVHLPDAGVSNAEICAALDNLLVTDDRLHIYSHFGSDDPDILLDTIRFLVTARSCRYIILDHITMAVSGLAGDDERRALEYLATRLEMMVKELDFALLMVSHVNDFGQTRGSHYLTKIADITIDAKRDTVHEDERERRTIHLSIPYNRFCSHTGPAGDIVFDDSTYVLTEETAPWLPTSPSVVPSITASTGTNITV